MTDKERIKSMILELEYGFISYDNLNSENHRGYKIIKDALEHRDEKRVVAKGRKPFTNDDFNGHSGTRYYCPSCMKQAKHCDPFCSRCGQKLIFPTFTWSEFVQGEKQTRYIHWSDEECIDV